MIQNIRPEVTPVADLQEMLRYIFYDSGLSADGHYEEETKNSVMRLQKKGSLPVTGIADNETWDLAARTAGKARIHRGCAEHLCIVLQPGQVMIPGCRNTHLFLIQGILTAMACYFDNMPPVHLTGILDSETENAIRWFQAGAGLTPSGSLDRNTWRCLCRQYRLIVGDGTGTYPVHTVPEK